MKRETTQKTYEKDQFNTQQNFLYKRALFGLNMFTKEELDIMHPDKKDRINKVHKRTQYVLNLWKQELTIRLTNYYLEKTFPKSNFVRCLINDCTMLDSGFINVLNFKSLGINKKRIINKLITEGILPKHFYNIELIEKPFIFKFKKSKQELILC